MLTLLVKGSLGEAFHAASDRGMPAEYLGQDDFGSVLLGVDACHYSRVMLWFLEPVAMSSKVGYGYPAGTLLYYSEAK